MFTSTDKIEILTKLGYKVESERAPSTRATRLTSMKSMEHYVLHNGEKLSIDVVFKKELTKHIFNF